MPDLKKLLFLCFICLNLTPSLTLAEESQVSTKKLLFAQLNPKSLNQLASFYKIYPESKEGRKSLKAIAFLFQKHFKLNFDSVDQKNLLLTLNDINHLILSFKETAPHQNNLDNSFFNSLPFPNRHLKGYQARTLDEILALPVEEVDLSTALIISHAQEGENIENDILHYNYLLDLMALNVLFQSPTKEKNDLVKTLNYYLFQELKFRFPPESLYKENIDTYTFLPAVVDSKEGVCLGVCILYLALAQRLEIPLEIITPPGHIYLKHLKEEGYDNIETTARGTNLPDKVYFNVNIMHPQVRNIKEAVGLSHMNRASVFWKNKDYKKALKEYESTLLYIKNDPLAMEFKAYQHLMLGEDQHGYELLKKVLNAPSPNQRFPSLLAKETFSFKLKKEDLEILIDLEEDSLEHLDQQIQSLESLIKRKPFLHSTKAQLAYLSLRKFHHKDAIRYFKEYQKLEPKDVSVCFLLTRLHLSRGEIRQAVAQFENLEKLLPANILNKELKDLKLEIKKSWPLI
ncbi:Uncharacterized protein AB751O23_AF_00130 [Chlamydiales bacterium SCGC AB-751-O23]|jgi:hypothetical protein|nr:Uncharacterized protein AB751O23_AF_00130 [Chlamydiales bacterium SCGC AB-751-O23]